MIVVVMGVSASGKSTVGRALVEALQRPCSSPPAPVPPACGASSATRGDEQRWQGGEGEGRGPGPDGWTFADGDDFHPEENKAKMAAGVPLNDADRMPWLRSIAGFMDEVLDAGRHAVIACSALKARYRHLLRHEHMSPLVLRHGSPWLVLFVYLHGTLDVLRERIRARSGHFMKEEMLQSQLEALEEPAPLAMGADGLPREPPPAPAPPGAELPSCGAFTDAAAWVDIGRGREEVAADARRWVDAAARALAQHESSGPPA